MTIRRDARPQTSKQLGARLRGLRWIDPDCSGQVVATLRELHRSWTGEQLTGWRPASMGLQLRVLAFHPASALGKIAAA